MSATKTIHVRTITHGLVPVEVEVHGLLGVQPHIMRSASGYYISEDSFTVVHIPTGLLVSTRDWSFDEAQQLAIELATLDVWERVPSSIEHLIDGQIVRVKQEMLHGDVEQIEAILAKHRAKVLADYSTIPALGAGETEVLA